MADDSVIGKRYPGYTFPIERGQGPGVRAGDEDQRTPTTSTTRRR